MNKIKVPGSEKNIYFGEIHTHTAESFDAVTLGTGKGPHWAYQAAIKNRLDFAAVTDHAQTCIPSGYNEWVNSLSPKIKRPPLHPQGIHPLNWDATCKAAKEFNKPREFVTFLGYEWSSTSYGDYNIYYLRDNEPIRYAESVEALHSAFQNIEDVMLIPHHTGYQPGMRGMDWSQVDFSKAPFVEIISQHGFSEEDGLGRYHWNTGCMGPRFGGGTIRQALEDGYIFGFIGSSDMHFSYPGFYGTGLLGVHAASLDRQSLWEAFWKRRTYAFTGDRIILNFMLNEENMGSLAYIPISNQRNLCAYIDGWWQLDTIEVIKNGRIVKRWTEFHSSLDKEANRFKLGVDWGYSMNTDIEDWNIEVIVKDGEIEGCQPRFMSLGMDQEILELDKNHIRIRSQAGMNQAHGVSLDILGDFGTRVDAQRDGKTYLSVPIGELYKSSQGVQPFGNMQGSIYLSRAFPEEQFLACCEWNDTSPERVRDYYYIRVRQANDQWAWSSPIWVENI